jgi:hypothetical protein
MTGLQFCEVAHKCAHEDKRPFGSMVAGESIRHGSNDCHSVLLDFSVGCTAIIESARVSPGSGARVGGIRVAGHGGTGARHSRSFSCLRNAGSFSGTAR